MGDVDVSMLQREMERMRDELDAYKKNDKSLDQEHTDENPPAGAQMSPPAHPGWEFFKGPQFTVIVCTLLVILSGVAMYKDLGSKLDTVTSSLNSRIDGSNSKADSIRLELKSDIQVLSQRTDTRFDQVSSRFDALMTKMDADNRELRTLILSQQRTPQQR